MTSRYARLLALVTIVLLVASGPAFAQTDYDTDGDNYIEVANLAQLNAIRWDLNGDGAIDASATTADTTAYNTAFSNPASGMGCASTCTGYELTANLDFDENGDGEITSTDATYWNTGEGWIPIGDDSGNRYTGDFKGNGYTINNLFINRPSGDDQGLFGSIHNTSRIESLGVTNADVTGYQYVAILVGSMYGTVVACYTTGSITGNANGVGNGGTAGGLVGWAGLSSIAVTISSSYSTASVTGWSRVGGLVGQLRNGTLTNSYSTGTVTRTGGNSISVGGLLGWLQPGVGSVTASYCDTQTSGRSTCSGNSGGVGKTTAELQSPTGYTGIYANWNVNLDGDRVPDNPWNFGSASQYPTLKTPTQRQQVVDYDIDGDGLIDVSSLLQLNAIRYDLDGDGLPTGTNADTVAYAGAFPGGNITTSSGRMGCPSTGCTGYELMANLDFDENSDGAITEAGDPTYWNSGAGWAPLGTPTTQYSGNFKGNGYTINNLFIDRASTTYVGLFGIVIGANVRIESVGIINANVRGNDRVGILLGHNQGGDVVACYSTGMVQGDAVVGGLVGYNYLQTASIHSSYSTASVSGTSQVGGLVGWSLTVIASAVTNSYSIGSVSVASVDPSNADFGGLIGLASTGVSTGTASYWNTQTSAQDTSDGGSGVVGKTTAELQSPTGYTGIYADWNANLDGQAGNDDPWDFGATDQYPVLKYAGMNTTVQFQLQPAVATLTLTPSSISESGGMSTVTATLAYPLSVATTITVRPVAGAYTVAATDSTITIAAGNTANASDTVVITAVDNTQDEPNRSATVSGVAGLGSVTGATLTLEDDDPAPVATLAADPASISENGAVSTITAVLSRPSSAATTITVRPVAGTYTVAADSTITIAAGDTTNASDTVVITAVNNTRDELDRAVTVIGVAGNAQGAGNVTGATLTLEDDDNAPTVTMAVSPASIAETVEVSTVTATLSHTSGAATTITVSVTPVSPAVAADYTLSGTTTLTVAANATTSTGTVTITTVNNAVASGSKTVTVSGTPANSVGVGSSVTAATLTITDDDVPQVTLVLSQASISENAEVSTITATLDRTSSAATTITVSATPVSPAVAADFTLSSTTTLTIAANATTSTGTVTITSVNNTTDAPDKRVTVSATVTGGNMASLSSAVTLTITDDEAAPTVALTPNPASISEASGVSTVSATLSHASSAITTITVRPVAGAYTVGATDSTIIIAAGSTANTSDTVVITAVNNTRDEPNRTVTVSGVARNTQGAGSVTGASLTLTDDDAAPSVTLSVSPQSFSENGGVAMVSATLSHPSSAATTVTVAAVANVYTVSAVNTIVIAADATTSTGTVTITGVDNDRDAADNALTVTGTMTNSQGTGSVTGAAVTITDEDAPPMLSISSPSAVEGTALTFTVSLNQASGKVVTVAYADATTGSATSGTDYTALAAGSLTFAAGTTSQTFDVSVTDDSMAERPAPVRLSTTMACLN